MFIFSDYDVLLTIVSVAGNEALKNVEGIRNYNIKLSYGNNPLLLTDTRNISRRRFQSLELSWNYEDPCQYCKYVHLNGATKGQKSKCCKNGAAFRAQFPQLRQLPVKILHYARDRILHMSRNSVSYNSVLSCAATAVENDEGGGFEVIHGNHAVKHHGRTYHYLTSTNSEHNTKMYKNPNFDIEQKVIFNTKNEI